MLDCDKISNGWQVWLTPRQTRIIHDALVGNAMQQCDMPEFKKLCEWFGAEVEAKAKISAL